MMKKTILLFLSLALALSLAACGGGKTPAATQTPAPAPTAEPTPTPEPESTPEPTEDPALRDARLAAYQLALHQFAYDLRWPDGSETYFDPNFGLMEENFYAICDVNGDGAEELVIRFVTAPMAGKAERVYAYDAETGIYEALSGFPEISYYESGIAVLPVSHNQGYAGDALWPYSAYRYNAETGLYDFAAAVDAWSREMKAEGYPEEVDAEGAGAVYYVTEDSFARAEPISKSAFEAWETEFFGGEAPIALPLHGMGEFDAAGAN